MGCVTVILTRVGNGVSAAFKRAESGMSARYTRTGGMSVRFGLVCATNLGEGYLYASDALLITIDGGKLIVKEI